MKQNTHLGPGLPPQNGPAKGQTNPADPAALERHSRKCQICRHPDLEAIEEEYRDWLDPCAIARHYNLPQRALYRHFHGVGLASQRRENLRQVLDRILERASDAPVTGNTIIRAVRAYCCLTGDNRWVEPERRVVVHRPSRDITDGGEAPNQCAASPAASSPNLIDKIQLESIPTP